jgi:4-hydroxy-tetrahydrodipicolinate synthase
MNREDVDWHGYWPACPTPFTADGALDLESLRALVEWYVGQGMHGIFVNGTSGEWFSQSPEERRLVAETAIDQVAGRVTVVIGCTSLTAKEAAELGRHAIAAGADGIGSTPPQLGRIRRDRALLHPAASRRRS